MFGKPSYTISTSDGINLFVRDYSVENSNIVLLFIHGLGEHSGRYLNYIQEFNNHNISIFTIDTRGHGKSEGMRGHSPSYEKLMSDIHVFVNHVKDIAPNQKYILYGHSMGGNLVINYSIKNDKNINGIIASSPAIKPAIQPIKIKIILAKLFQKIIPNIRLNNGLDINGISKDPKVIEDYKNDPLNHDRLSIQLGLDLISSGNYALNNSYKITVPMLVFHGKKDRLTSYEASEKLVSNSKSKVKFIGFKNAYHEIHNDTEQEELLTNIFNWIKSI